MAVIFGVMVDGWIVVCDFFTLPCLSCLSLGLAGEQAASHRRETAIVPARSSLTIILLSYLVLVLVLVLFLSCPVLSCPRSPPTFPARAPPSPPCPARLSLVALSLSLSLSAVWMGVFYHDVSCERMA